MVREETLRRCLRFHLNTLVRMVIDLLPLASNHPEQLAQPRTVAFPAAGRAQETVPQAMKALTRSLLQTSSSGGDAMAVQYFSISYTGPLALTPGPRTRARRSLRCSIPNQVCMNFLTTSRTRIFAFVCVSVYLGTSASLDLLTMPVCQSPCVCHWQCVILVGARGPGYSLPRQFVSL